MACQALSPLKAAAFVAQSVGKPVAKPKSVRAQKPTMVAALSHLDFCAPSDWPRGTLTQPHIPTTSTHDQTAVMA